MSDDWTDEYRFDLWYQDFGYFHPLDPRNQPHRKSLCEIFCGFQKPSPTQNFESLDHFLFQPDLHWNGKIVER